MLDFAIEEWNHQLLSGELLEQRYGMDGILYVLPWLNSTDLIEEPSAGSEGEVFILHSGKKVGKLGLVLV